MSARPSRSPIATAEMLAIGAELLVGETRDTNSGDIARELSAIGVEIMRMTQLPDDLEVVSGALRDALSRVDLVVTTGGLGPTPDDLTRESIASVLEEEPRVEPELEAWLRELWAARDLPFSDVNLKQAWLIPSASALPNPNGTAPGWWVEREGKVIVAMPGPPRELHPMWRDQALPRLRQRGLGLDRAVHTLHLIGIGESMVVDLVGETLLLAENPRMATYARPDFVDLRVSAVSGGGRDAETIVRTAIESLSPRVDPYVFGADDDDWITALTSRLSGRTLATVEAGTGGYLGLLLGTAGFLVHAVQQRGTEAEVTRLASDARQRSRADIGLAAVAAETGDDMAVAVGLDIAGVSSSVTRTVFRGGDTGRRRAANTAVAELWRRLAD